MCAGAGDDRAALFERYMSLRRAQLPMHYVLDPKPHTTFL